MNPTPPRPMAGDFASAAMLRVLRQGLHDAGLLPAPPALPEGKSAAVSLETKRALLQRAVALGGVACLATLGRAVRHFAHEPTHGALASAGDATELLQRWGRLERYIHSRHRTQVLDIQAQAVTLRHVSLRPAAPPLVAENLVVLGVIAGFLEATGHQGVRAWAGGARVYPQADEAALRRTCAQGSTDQWRIGWRRTTVRPALASPQCVQADDHWPSVLRQAFAVFVDRLTAPPTVAELARQMGLSARSLQRQLQQEGLGFRKLLAEARYRTAGQWLLHGRLPLAEIGFLSGYADQSHFTREFRQHSGLTPAAYRTNFCAPK